MSCQSPCKRVGWVGAVIKVQSAQEQSRASGSSSLLCLRAYHKASILPSVTLPESTDDTISFPLTTCHLGGAEEMDGNQKGEVLLKKV